MPTLVDLLAGAGGSSAGTSGVSCSQLEVLLGVDIDPAAAATWSINRPGVPFLTIDLAPWNLVRLWSEAGELGVVRGEVDLPIGSPPCRLLSPAGKRRTDDEGNLLFLSMLEAV